MNMSYCRFENTVSDMEDCVEALRNAESIKELYKDMSNYEKEAFKRFFELCAEITEEFEDISVNNFD